MITRCSMCTGKKVIMGLGSIIKSCPGCGGIGHVKLDDVVVADDNVLNIRDAQNTHAELVKIDKRTKQYKAHLSEQVRA